MMHRLAAALGCAAALIPAGAGAVAPATAAAPAPAARPRPAIRVGTLSNGLRLLCRANDSSEIVSIVCLVRAGLPDEPEEQAGLAALTAEALRFGTTTHPGKSFDELLTLGGGNLRTTPGFDFTEVTVVATREQFRPALKLIADVVAHPRLSAEDVQQAREVLKRRMAGLQEDFTAASYQSLCSQLYQKSPYGRPLAGYAETLDRLTRDDVQKFWAANYVQNRITVAVVGDVDSARALDLAQKEFADVPFRPAASTPAPPSESLIRPRVELLQRNSPGAPLAQLMVGYLVPAASRANYAVYALLDAIVGGGKRARLFSNIREKQNLGYELGSFYQPLLYQSHMVGYVMTPYFRRNPRTEQFEQVPTDPVKTALIEQFRQLAAAGPTEVELARARAYVVGRYALRQERTRDQAKWLAWNSAMKLGHDFDDVFPARVQAVTREQLQAAARATLTNYALVVTVPSPPM